MEFSIAIALQALYKRYEKQKKSPHFMSSLDIKCDHSDNSIESLGAILICNNK